MAPSGGHVEIDLEVRNRTKRVLQWTLGGTEQIISASSGRASARIVIQSVGSLINVTPDAGKTFSVTATVYWSSLSYARRVDVLSTDDGEVQLEYLAFVHVCPPIIGPRWTGPY
jgi:hypothetical protein